jgi:hypothetical protein
MEDVRPVTLSRIDWRAQYAVRWHRSLALYAGYYERRSLVFHPFSARMKQENARNFDFVRQSYNGDNPAAIIYLYTCDDSKLADALLRGTGRRAVSRMQQMRLHYTPCTVIIGTLFGSCKQYIDGDQRILLFSGTL